MRYLDDLRCEQMTSCTQPFETELDFFRGLKGGGVVSWGNRQLSASFILTISPDYAVTIDSSMSMGLGAAYELANEDLSAKRVDHIGVSGITEQGQMLICEQARRRNLTASLKNDPANMQLSAAPFTRIIVQDKELQLDEGGTIVFGIMNLKKEIHGPLTFHMGSSSISGLPVSKYDEILKKIKTEEIQRAVTYEWTTSFQSVSEIQAIEDRIYILTLMLSAVKINDVKPFYSVARNRQGDVVCAKLYTDLRESNFISFFKMIDDKHIGSGTEQYVDKCYEGFSNVHEKIDLHPFIYDFLFAARTSEIHISMVVLILGLEYLVTHYGRKILGWDSDDTQTLIGKLKRLNRKIRCIPKQYLDDEWSNRIRNPLIHTGIIVDLSHEEVIEALYDLYRLTTLVFLRLTEYSGLYLNFSWPPKLNSLLSPHTAEK